MEHGHRLLDGVESNGTAEKLFKQWNDLVYRGNGYMIPAKLCKSLQLYHKLYL